MSQSTQSSTLSLNCSSALCAWLSQACTSCQSSPTSRSLFLDSLAFSVGGLGLFAVSPTVEGNELIWVKEPACLYLGKIGNGGKYCLLSHVECTIKAHMANKCDLPSGPFLTLQKGPHKGFAQVVLETEDLDNDLVESLLGRKQVDWGREFAQLKAGNARLVAHEESNKELLQTCKKHMAFKTPAKANAL